MADGCQIITDKVFSPPICHAWDFPRILGWKKDDAREGRGGILMSEASMTNEGQMADPLRTAADAMALAAQAAKDGAADAQARVSEAMPAINRFFSRLTYTSF